MRLFDLFGRDRIEAAWEYKANGLLWHVRPTDAGAIVGEERYPDRKTVTFFCIDRDSGQVLWRDTNFGEQWWTGVEAVHRDILFLHGFITPELPQHRGITAIDLFAGRKLWERSDLRYIGAYGDSVVAMEGNPGSGRFLGIDRRTGATREELDQETMLSQKDESADLEDALRFPVPLEAAAEENPALASHVRAHLLDARTAGPVSVMAHGKFLAMSYHEHLNAPDMEHPVLNNILVILDMTQDKPVFVRVLDAGAEALVPESFFVQHDTLFCIQDRRTLAAVPLGSVPESASS